MIWKIPSIFWEPKTWTSMTIFTWEDFRMPWITVPKIIYFNQTESTVPCKLHPQEPEDWPIFLNIWSITPLLFSPTDSSGDKETDWPWLNSCKLPTSITTWTTMKSRSMKTFPKPPLSELFKKISYQNGLPQDWPNLCSTTEKETSPSQPGADSTTCSESSSQPPMETSSSTTMNSRLSLPESNSQEDSTKWSTSVTSHPKKKSNKPPKDYGESRPKMIICTTITIWCSYKRKSESIVYTEKPEKSYQKKNHPFLMKTSQLSHKESCSTCMTLTETNLSMSKIGWYLSPLPSRIWVMKSPVSKDWDLSRLATPSIWTITFKPHWMSSHTPLLKTMNSPRS